MDELVRHRGQIAAAGQQLPPEAPRRGQERHPTKCLAHLPQQQRQVRFKTTPVPSISNSHRRTSGRVASPLKPAATVGVLTTRYGCAKAGRQLTVIRQCRHQKRRTQIHKTRAVAVVM